VANGGGVYWPLRILPQSHIFLFTGDGQKMCVVGSQWLKSVIPATWEAEIRIVV
jgi:hypothetical protein